MLGYAKTLNKMNAFVKMMNFLRSHSMRVPVWIRLTVMFIAFAIPLYWAFTDSGMYAAIARWQAGDDGGQYNIALAFLLPLLFFLLPAFAIILLIAQFFPEKNANETKLK